MAVNKVVDSFDEAMKDVFDGAVILIGGFGNPGACPTWLLKALRDRGAKDLTLVGNSPGFGRAMIDMTTSSSIKVKPLCFFILLTPKTQCGAPGWRLFI